VTDLPAIIGLNGVARAGKDTVAKILHDLYGYEVLSFSDALNKALIALNPMVPLGGEYKDGRIVRLDDKGWTHYATLIEGVGYERAKEIPEVRRLLQAMGTEVGRDLLGANIWVEALFNNLPTGKLIAISNVRFPNEFNAVQDRGGVVWRVERPGFEPSNGHVSDTALDTYFFDAYIDNNSSVAALADKVMDLLAGSPVNFAHNEGIRA
jgi:hypothetical protein